jgi:hypothetical protein
MEKNLRLPPASWETFDTGWKKRLKSLSLSRDFLISGGRKPAKGSEIFFEFFISINPYIYFMFDS